MTSVTHNELVADNPESKVELNPASNIITNKNTAQVGSNVATVWTPIIEASTPSGRVIPRAGFAPKNPKVDNAIGTISNRIAPNMNAFDKCPFFIENALCQYCWSEIAPEIKPIEVTIPSENAIPGSNTFLIPDSPPKPAVIAEKPPAADHVSGRIINPIMKISVICTKSVMIDASSPEIYVYARAMTKSIGMTIIKGIPVSK